MTLTGNLLIGAHEVADAFALVLVADRLDPHRPATLGRDLKAGRGLGIDDIFRRPFVLDCWDFFDGNRRLSATGGEEKKNDGNESNAAHGGMVLREASQAMIIHDNVERLRT